ncbi:MAG: hypothetical protein LBE15_06270 [Burkholderiales bacterium]|jgi:hypothetical protein|nr:hypothetical protein [Burkholderiales bacterium]
MKLFIKRFVPFLVSAFVACGVQAQESAIAFDGDFYQKMNEDFNSVIQVVEYIPQRENASNWTRKIALRHYPHLTDARATGALLDTTIKQNPANTAEKSVARGDEALVSYLHHPEGASLMEYRILYYTKPKEAEGLVTYEYTYRFKPDPKLSVGEQIPKERQRWLGAFANSRWALPPAFLKKP